MLLIRNKRKFTECQWRIAKAKDGNERAEGNKEEIEGKKSFSSFDATENGLAAIQSCLQNQYGCYWLRNKINGQVLLYSATSPGGGGEQDENKNFSLENDPRRKWNLTTQTEEQH